MRWALRQRTVTGAHQLSAPPSPTRLPQQLCPRYDNHAINTLSLLWSHSIKFFTAIITRSIFIRLRDRLFWTAFQLSSFEFVWLSIKASTSSCTVDKLLPKMLCRLQKSPYFCVFKYVRAVKQKVWKEGENREQDWGETLRACEAGALRARKTLTPRFTDFFTDFEKKTDCFAV